MQFPSESSTSAQNPYSPIECPSVCTVPPFARRMPDLMVTASGEYVPRAVELGQDDFLPWNRGVSL